MAHIAIIADDLTGANDTGIQFKKNGLDSVVILSASYTKEADVLIVDSDSRREPREKVEENVTAAIILLKKHKPNHWYKKIDSTMRGKIGLEIQLALNLIELPFAIVCPAYPATQRQVVGGQLLIKGIPVAETELANDVLTPVIQSRVKDIIESQSNLKCGEITLEDYSKGLNNCFEKIDRFLKKGIKVVSLDCIDNKHMRMIGEIIKGYADKNPLIVGSAGLAEIVSNIWSNNQCVDRKNVLVIAGSVSQTTSNQVNKAIKDEKIAYFNLDFSKVFSQTKEQYLERLVKNIVENFNKGLDVVVRSAPSRKYVKEARDIGYSLAGLNEQQVSARIAEFFADIVNNTLDHYPTLSRLFLTGGDVAIRICKKLDTEGLSLIEEAEAGIPVSKLIGGKRQGAYVITKAGAFGGENAILNAIQKLKEY